MESEVSPWSPQAGWHTTPDSPDVDESPHHKEVLQSPDPRALNADDSGDFDRRAYLGTVAPGWHGERPRSAPAGSASQPSLALSLPQAASGPPSKGYSKAAREGTVSQVVNHHLTPGDWPAPPGLLASEMLGLQPLLLAGKTPREESDYAHPWPTRLGGEVSKRPRAARDDLRRKWQRACTPEATEMPTVSVTCCRYNKIPRT